MLQPVRIENNNKKKEKRSWHAEITDKLQISSQDLIKMLKLQGRITSSQRNPYLNFAGSVAKYDMIFNYLI